MIHIDSVGAGVVGQEDEATPQISRLLRSAACAVDCPAGAFYQTAAIGANLGVVARLGIESAQETMPVPAPWADCDSTDVLEPLIVNDCQVAAPWPVPELSLSTKLPVRTIILLPVMTAGNDSLLGIVLLADHCAHAGVSPAQLYVLKTHAAQLGQQIERASRREVREPPLSGPVSERLRLLESVVINANDAVLITQAEPIDLPGPRIVYCNAAFTRTTGYTEDEVLGKTPRILQSEQIDREALGRLRQALRRWRPIEIELLNRHKDGTQFWVELSIVPVADEAGWYTHWVSVQRDVTERKKAEGIAHQVRIAQAEKIALEAKLAERQRIEKSLKHAAFHDDLTQLSNRAHVMGHLDGLLARRTEDDALPEGFVLFMDLDRFKLVNDSLGHRAGDLLLMEMARRLEECVRDQDMLARVGGDEFVVVQSIGRDPQIAVAIAQRILSRLQAPFRINGHDLFVTASIGIVEMALGYQTSEALLRDADIAMYAAKYQGPGQYILFSESMRAKVVETLSLQTDLRQALVDNQLSIHYQPIVDLATGALHSVEALARWQHPTRGLVSPAVFIPIAEEIGLIDSIGRWIMHSSCRQMAEWNLARCPAAPLRVSVNVSVRELRQFDFVDRVRSILVDTGLPAHLLQLEITESLFLQEPAIVCQLLAQLRGLGVQIALDDFGTGYSSLSYIDRYEIDTIKIDRSFMMRINESRRTFAIVQMIIGLGRTLGLEIVAEGIETEEQRQVARSLDCPLAQGFLLARPMPAVDIEALFEKRI